MSTIIRASDRSQDIQQPLFNFEDMSSQATRYLDRIRGEAKNILGAAHKEAESIKRKAEVDGRAAAIKKVAEMVEQQLAQQLTTLLPALRQAVGEIRIAKQAWQSHWEKCAIHLATAIAARVIRQEITHQPEVPLKLLREGLELAAGSGHLRIHLNPADLKTLGSQAQAIAGELASLASTEFVPDPNITQGGCRIDTRLGIIDQQLESQLARIEEELSG
jgi:flagellar biosynthesis/type III secretory pathway protein FliH